MEATIESTKRVVVTLNRLEAHMVSKALYAYTECKECGMSPCDLDKNACDYLACQIELLKEHL